MVNVFSPCRRAQRGFTLIEAIVVIVISGIIAGMVAMFIRQPIDAYLDTSRRVMLSDIADTTARRIARDLRSALPNSLRVSSDARSLEFVPILAAGRYRTAAGNSASDKPLIFGAGGSLEFDVFGPPVTIPPGSSLVIYNMGTAGLDVYELDSPVRRNVTPGINLPRVAFSGAPFGDTISSPGSHFQIVGRPVSYVCDAATQTLWRYSAYDFLPGQPALPVAGATRAALATHLSACTFAYNAGSAQIKHNGLVSMLLSFTQDGETVTLQHQVAVDNAP